MHRAEVVFSVVRATLLDPKLLDKSRRRKGAFTRNCGKLPYWTIIKLLMSNIKRTIAATLDEFFTSLSRLSGISISETPACSQQAFSKARSGIDHKKSDSLVFEDIPKTQSFRNFGFLCC